MIFTLLFYLHDLNLTIISVRGFTKM